MAYITMESPVGRLGIAEQAGAITHLWFESRADSRPAGLPATEERTPLLERAQRQLEEYFAGGRRAFDLPLQPQGTDFQRAVWRALVDIPYGETRNYRQMAEAAGSPKGYRAAGLANNRNPIVVVIPCHRVVGSDGSLTGYGGGLDKKEYLLALERG